MNYKKGQILVGQEAEKFLQENPGYKYDMLDKSGEVVDSIAPEPKDYGILDQIGAALVQPFADTTSGISEQFRELKTREERGDAEYTPAYMSSDEWDQYVQNPLGKNVQNAAGVGAFFVPGGSGIAGLAKAGAVAGGMSGFSNADLREGDIVGETLQGAATGGITGGALGAIGKGVGKVAKGFSKNPAANTFDDVLSAGGESPFTAAYDDLARVTNLDDPMQVQRLQDFADRIAPAAEEGLADAGAVLDDLGRTYDITPTPRQSISDKLRTAASEREQVGLNKAVGGAAPNRGAGIKGARLEKATLEALEDTNVWSGKAIKSADDLQQLGDNILKVYGPEVPKIAKDLSESGVVVTLDEVLAPLEAELARTTNRRLKKPIQDVIKDINEEFAGRTTITPDELYSAKQGWGDIANFKGDARPSVQKVYARAYGAANDVLDETFDNAGVSVFRDLNKKVEIGKRLGVWAESAANKARPQRTATDMLQDALGMGGLAGAGTGMALGGPAGAGLGYVGSRFMQSAGGERLVGKVFRKTADVVDFLGGNVKVPKRFPVDKLNNAIKMLADDTTIQSASDTLMRTAGKLGPIAATGLVQRTPEEAVDDILKDQENIVERSVREGVEPGQAMARAYAKTAPKEETILTAEMLFNDKTLLNQALSNPASATIVLQMAGFDSKESTQIIQLMGLGGTTGEEASPGNKLEGAISEMERLYGLGGEQSLAQKGTTVGPLGIISRIGTDIGKATNQDFTDRIVAYNQMATLAAGLINQARGAGTLNEGEFQTMMKSIPNEYSSEKQAAEWFTNVRRILSS